MLAEEEDNKPNPVTQRVKIIMVRNVSFLSADITTWYKVQKVLDFKDGAVLITSLNMCNKGSVQTND